jgi:hypothetical protein
VMSTLDICGVLSETMTASRAITWTKLYRCSAEIIDEVTRICRQKGNCMCWRDEVLLLS